MTLWNDINSLDRLARYIPYFFIILGFLVAGAGQFVRAKVDVRVGQLRREAEARLKRTPPKMSAYLAASEQSGELLVVIDAENEIPFRCRWAVVTEDSRQVSGVMLEDHELHPTSDRKRFSVRADIDTNAVRNQFLELRFRFESIYSAELGEPVDLRGEIVHQYRLDSGKVFDW